MVNMDSLTETKDFGSENRGRKSLMGFQISSITLIWLLVAFIYRISIDSAIN